MIAQTTPSTAQVIEGFGLPAGIVIVSLTIALIFTVRLYLKGQTEKDELRKQQIEDAKQTRDILVEPLEKQANMLEKIYDIVLSGKGK